MTSVAILGAGLGGLCAAHTLRARGDHTITLFDKGYFPGGRLASRRSREHDASIDHGAQYFTAREPRFEHLVSQWQHQGVVSPWQPDLLVIDTPGAPPSPASSSALTTTRWVAKPHMNRLATHLASELDLRTRHQVTHITRDTTSSRYTLTCTTPQGSRMFSGFDALILNLPPAQASPLLHGVLPETHALLETLRDTPPMEPCWAWMGWFEKGTLAPGFQAAFINVEQSPLSWAAVDSSKPGRSKAFDTLLLHASTTWSRAHLEDPPEQVEARLFSSLVELLPDSVTIPAPLTTQVHRWRYARPAEVKQGRDAAIVHDPALGIALCGDWLEGGRVEGACLSGMKAAEYILGPER